MNYNQEVQDGLKAKTWVATKKTKVHSKEADLRRLEEEIEDEEVFAMHYHGAPSSDRLNRLLKIKEGLKATR